MINKTKSTIKHILSLALILLVMSSTAYGKEDKHHKKVVKQKKMTVISKHERDPGLYDKIISKASNRHKIDPDLIKAIIMIESSNKANAVSKKGAKGLMQIMPAIAKSLGIKNAHHPEQNIEAGTKYLKYLMDEYDGNIKLVIAAYNAGTGKVNRYHGIPPNKKSRSYVKKVLKHYYAYKAKTTTGG